MLYSFTKAKVTQIDTNRKIEMNDIGLPPLCFKNFTYLIAETLRLAQDLLQST